MRLEDDEHRVLLSATLGLTREEASELVSTLEQMLARPVGGAGHEHVSSSDYLTEVTVWFPDEE